MAAQLQQVAPVPNGSIPIMSGIPGAGQPTILYQQQPYMMGAQPQQMGGGYIPRKPFARNPQEEQCKIFVGGVGKNTSEDSLRAYFGKFGEINDSVIMRDKQSGEPRGFAFVTFKNPNAVQAVIEQCNNGGHSLDGKVYLQVRKYFPKAEVDPKPAVPQGPTQQGNLQAMYDAEKANVIHAAGNPEYKGPMKVSPDLKVFVGGIGIGTTEDDVRKYFSSFGKVVGLDMPRDYNTKHLRGFAFVGFENQETVSKVTEDRYHQINGKTVEVKGADEQQQHLNRKRAEGNPVNILPTMGRGTPKMAAQVQPGSIGTISGYGAYANIAAAQPQVILPQGMQGAAGVTQYVQIPQASTGGYVFDPATNTYYQLPGNVLAGATGGLFAGAGGGLVTSMAGVGGANPYAGLIIGGGGQQVITSPQVQRPGVVTSDLSGNITIGAYQNETSTFGPTRHILGAGQQPIAGSADPHVVYSTATSISAGDAAISTPRGFHPYGR